MTNMEITGEHDVRDLEVPSVEEPEAEFSEPPYIDRWYHFLAALLIGAGLAAASLYAICWISLHILFGTW